MMGWECPKCHVIHAPDVKRCVECSPPKLDFGKLPIGTPSQPGHYVYPTHVCPAHPFDGLPKPLPWFQTYPATC